MDFKNNKRPLLYGGGALTLAIITGVLVMRTPVSVSENEQPAEIPTVKISAQEPGNSAATTPQEAKPAKETTTGTLAPSTEEANLKPFENKTELAEFKVLKQKVFLTEPEKEQKKNFLRDRYLLESVKALFKYPAPYQDLEEQQNVAVDLLLEAIKSGGDADTARAVFKDLISDPTIEDQQLTPAQRQNLAGVKAEVLHLWSSLEPERTKEIQNSLPGPVSKKIWKNVQAHQQNNELESAITK